MVGKKVTVRYCVSNLKRFTTSDSQPLAYGRYTTNIEGMRETILPGDKGMRGNLSVLGTFPHSTQEWKRRWKSRQS